MEFDKYKIFEGLTPEASGRASKSILGGGGWYFDKNLVEKAQNKGGKRDFNIFLSTRGVQSLDSSLRGSAYPPITVYIHKTKHLIQ